MESNKKYKRAIKGVEELKSFYIYLTVYISINIALIIINLLTSPDDRWFVFRY